LGKPLTQLGEMWGKSERKHDPCSFFHHNDLKLRRKFG
jgi:hypothetical protein